MFRSQVWLFLVMAVALAGWTGCQTGPSVAVSDTVPYLDVRLREGDTLKISFPGAPNLDSTYQIRRDGKITLTLGGEVMAAGLTPAELEKEILRVYDTQLAVKQVVVLATSSGYPIYVSGAVLRPGKFTIERPITIVEAIMEAGGFDRAKANPRKVSILRQIDGKTMRFEVDVQAMIDGKQPKPFYLKPSDVVTVPEKFVWF